MITDCNNCSGCSACANICPNKAITMIENSEGFLYPQIDEEKCTHCQLCKKVCPINSYKSNNTKKPDCYAFAANDEIRQSSSSGGAFSALAEYILNLGGFVCGCMFNLHKLEAEHKIISSVEELEDLKRSKYVQSDIKNCYTEIKHLLNSNKFVLFSGTPCQVAGLYKFLQKDYEKLITIDILCHGVPSPKLYKKYLKELQALNNDKILGINFRNKIHGWNPILTHTTTTTTTTYSFPQYKDTYFQLFLSNICLRKNCTNCKFCKQQRPGDFTIGDFWGIDKYNLSLNDGKGTSLILINNKKAEKIFLSLKNDSKFCKQVPLKYAILGNRNLYSPHNVHPMRNEFFQDMDKYSTRQLVDKYLNNKFECGIMNLWSTWNYGAILTCYALQETIRDLGHTVSVINYQPKAWNNKKKYPRCRGKIEFVNNYLNLSKICKNKKDLKSLNDIFETFIVGSDQVWNWKYDCKYLYFLDFVKNSKKKIACAASMVFEHFHQPEEVKTMMEYYMKRFDAVSVRESNNVEVCKNEFNTDATLILDPVFLHDKNDYICLANNSIINNKDEYIATYILEKNKVLLKNIETLAKQLGCKIVKMNNNESIEDWLKIIRDAKYVITDSFHGTCFSIIFNKQFLSITNSHGNSRFYSLLNLLRLNNRLLNGIDNVASVIDLLTANIDYITTNKIIEDEKVRSLIWLKNSIEKPKNFDSSTIESRLIYVLLEGNDLINGHPYVLRAYKKINRIYCWIVRKIKTSLFLIFNNERFLK